MENSRFVIKLGSGALILGLVFTCAAVGVIMYARVFGMSTGIELFGDTLQWEYPVIGILLALGLSLLFLSLAKKTVVDNGIITKKELGKRNETASIADITGILAGNKSGINKSISVYIGGKPGLISRPFLVVLSGQKGYTEFLQLLESKRSDLFSPDWKNTSTYKKISAPDGAHF